MGKRAAELEAEVGRWLSAAEAADAEEDKAFGRDRSGEELPDWIADKEERAEKIRAAQAELEAEARAAAAAKAERRPRLRKGDEPRAAETGKARRPAVRRARSRSAENFTDPESRIMKTKDGFIQGYNAQAAVDATAQVVVAHGLDAKQSDQHQLAPIVDGSKPISAASRRSCRPTPAIAPTPILRR